MVACTSYYFAQWKGRNRKVVHHPPLREEKTSYPVSTALLYVCLRAKKMKFLITCFLTFFTVYRVLGCKYVNEEP